MNVLSLFDGISCGQLALQRAGVPVESYLASEIDRDAIKVTMRHFPNTVQIGDVKTIKNIPFNIDLLIGGSPCQGFSAAGKGLGFDDPRSKLLFDYIHIRDTLRPKWFLLENVRMKQDDMHIVTTLMGVQPIIINSRDFSAQNRTRLYWTNIPIAPWHPIDITVRDILAPYDGPGMPVTPSRILMAFGKCKDVTDSDRAYCVTTKQDRWSNTGIIRYRNFYRYFTPVECERLQTLPDNYTSNLSDAKRYHAIGNGWTVDVIAHIFRGLHTCIN